MYEEFYEITNWIEINTKSDQPRYSELVASNNYVKDYESIYASACPDMEQSEFTQDPSKVGGIDLTAAKVGNNKIVFGGKINWYAEDKSLGRAEGNRVGVQIKPADGVLDEYPQMQIKIGNKVYTKDAFESSGVLWYYPLITKDSKRFVVNMEWNENNKEKFIIEILPGTVLKTKDDHTNVEAGSEDSEG